MKKIVMLLFSVVMITTTEAKGKKDPVVMTVAGKEIPLSEFIFIAKKDNAVDFNDRKSVNNYVELFKNYKLKVADAEARSINQAPKFEIELERFKRQLQESFLSDKSGEREAMRVIYDRTKKLPGFKQILFRFDKDELVTADTVALYNLAMEAYNRVQSGESFESVGEALTQDGNNHILYSTVNYLFPLRVVKVLEDKVHSMEPGEVSLPLRSLGGFHVIKMERMTPNPGRARIAHILIKHESTDPTDEEIEETRKKADLIYKRILSGEDFAKLAEEYSNDTISGKRGGLLSEFGLGEMLEPIERTTFEFKNVDDISEPVQTHLGFHILKLIGKTPDISFEDMESSIFESMRVTERNFDLYEGFDQKMKERHGFILYQDAYDELERLADEYFPTDTSFYFRGLAMEKPLVRLDTIDFTQDLFVDYMFASRVSAKTYSKDFMKEHFDLFVRTIVTEMEREILERDYPEYNMLVNEYYDGILLFELSNSRVWLQPVDEQEQLEAEWIKELNEKYPVTINRKALKNIKKYIN